LVPLAGSRLLA